MTYQGIVITPTTLSEKLNIALESVSKQTIPIKHLIVVDGLETNDPKIRKTQEAKIKALEKHKNVEVVVLSENTGADGFYGHRIYAGFSFLVNEPHVFFLDQDNWFESNHCESLINTIGANNYDWAYSLRNIMDENLNFVEQDNCESLGTWPVWNGNHHHVDTSSYCFKKEFLVKVGAFWYQGYGGDRIFYKIITELLKHQNFGCSGEYTLNYRLDGNPKSLAKEFIHDGNRAIAEQYPNGDYPWKKK